MTAHPEASARLQHITLCRGQTLYCIEIASMHAQLRSFRSGDNLAEVSRRYWSYEGSDKVRCANLYSCRSGAGTSNAKQEHRVDELI